MKKLLENLSENMTAEEIKEAEKDIESLKKWLKSSKEWQGDWEKIGIDYSQIDSSAKADIGIIGEEEWKDGRSELLDRFTKELKDAEEMVKKSKENLKKKQA